MNTSPCAHFSIRKILGPANRGEAAFPRHHHIILAAGAVDDKHIAAAVKSADNADMGILRVKHKVARLGIAPVNGGTVAVLCRSPTAMPNDILSAALVVEHPIHHSRTIQSEGPHSAGGGAALGCDLHRHSPAGVPADYQRFYSDR